jgi:hypothetical protein
MRRALIAPSVVFYSARWINKTRSFCKIIFGRGRNKNILTAEKIEKAL